MIVPEGDEPLEGGDELLFVATAEVEEQLREQVLRRARSPASPARAMAGGGVTRSWQRRRGLRPRCARSRTAHC